MSEDVDTDLLIKGIPLFLQAAKAGYAGFRRWREPNNFGRLERLLNERFEDDEFIYGTDWAFLHEGAESAALLDDFFVNQAPLRPGLIEEVERHLDVVSDAAPLKSQLAEEVVAAIESVANEIWSDETDRVIFELRRLFVPLAEQNDAILTRLGELKAELTPRVVSFSAAPEDIRPSLERLAEEDATIALKLHAALLAGRSVIEAALGLIRGETAWTLDGPGAGSLWHILGRIAAKHGAWAEAESAYLRAVDLGYPRRANVLAKAAEAALAQGETDRHRELLNKAACDDPSDPAVAILEAQLLDTGDDRLARLEHAAEPTPGEASAVWVARATAHLMEHRYRDAEEAAKRALELDPKSLHAREMTATVDLFKGREQLSGSPDVPRLRDARQTFLDIRAVLLRLGRSAEAARMLGRAVESSFVAGERIRARELLEGAAADEGLNELDAEARTDLAEHAMSLYLPELARQLLPAESSSETARLIRSSVQVMAAQNPEDLRDGLSELDDLVATTADDSVRGQAAISRLGACDMDEVSWSEAAEQALIDLGRPEIASGLRAQYLQRTGDVAGAEAMLIASDDPRALDLLIDAALQAGDVELALQRSERLLALAPSPSRRVEHADLLLRAGRVDEARAELGALRRDGDAPHDVRAKAYYLAVRDAHQSRQYEDAKALTEEWMELEPSYEGAAWMRVDALLWLGRADEAVNVARAAGLEPTELGEARLLAHVYLRGVAPAEALAEIAALSDRFDRADESLEGLVVVAWTAARGAVDDDLAGRGARSMAEFAERFPDSRAMARAVGIEELSEILREQATHAAELDAMGHDIVAGRIPVSMWAQAAARSVAQMWSSLRVLPLAFVDAERTAADEEGAAVSFGRGAVWDPSALAVNALLAEGVKTAIRKALPRAVIAQAVMQDADFAAIDAVDERPAEDEMRVAWDVGAAQPIAFMRPAAEVERERKVLREVLGLARELEVVSDVDRRRPTKVDDLMPEVDGVEAMVRAVVVATLGVALREGLPVYSDDRVLRLLYRQEGVVVFGTLSLLELLEAKGLITSEARDAAIATLAQAGAIEFA